MHLIYNFIGWELKLQHLIIILHFNMFYIWSVLCELILNCVYNWIGMSYVWVIIVCKRFVKSDVCEICHARWQFHYHFWTFNVYPKPYYHHELPRFRLLLLPLHHTLVSTKAKHVIWWSQYCEHQGLACEADEDWLMKNLLELIWTRIVQVKTLCQHEDGWVIRSWSLVGFVCWWLA